VRYRCAGVNAQNWWLLTRHFAGAEGGWHPLSLAGYGWKKRIERLMHPWIMLVFEAIYVDGRKRNHG
jgi:hypothetical protein